jgi:hypothetical protein
MWLFATGVTRRSNYLRNAYESNCTCSSAARMRLHQRSLLWLQQALIQYFCATARLRATCFRAAASALCKRQFDLDPVQPHTLFSSARE